MRTRGIQKGEGGRKSRAYFSPGGAGVESTAPNFQRPLRKRVADMKHGFVHPIRSVRRRFLTMRAPGDGAHRSLEGCSRSAFDPSMESEVPTPRYIPLAGPGRRHAINLLELPWHA